MDCPSDAGSIHAGQSMGVPGVSLSPLLRRKGTRAPKNAAQVPTSRTPPDQPPMACPSWHSYRVMEMRLLSGIPRYLSRDNGSPRVCLRGDTERK